MSRVFALQALCTVEHGRRVNRVYCMFHFFFFLLFSWSKQLITFIRVLYISEKDYPPKANAGSNVVISLPKNAVTLYGNRSTDDKGITSYEWIKQSESDKLAVDMTVRDYYYYAFIKRHISGLKTGHDYQDILGLCLSWCGLPYCCSLRMIA